MRNSVVEKSGGENFMVCYSYLSNNKVKQKWGDAFSERLVSQFWFKGILVLKKNLNFCDKNQKEEREKWEHGSS